MTAQEHPEFSAEAALPPGIKVTLAPQQSVIEIDTLQCGKAMGRLTFLLMVTCVWCGAAVFFGLVAQQAGEKVGPVIFCVLFIAMFLLTFVACLGALGSERITIT